MDVHMQTTFIVLKPLCDKVALSPSVDHFSDLKAAVDTVPPEGLQKLCEYVLFPVELHLHNHKNLSKKIIITAVDCMRAIVSRISIKELKNLLKLYSVLFSLITEFPEPGLRKEVPEELKLAVVQCVSELFLRSERSVLNEFYTREHYPKLSLGIYTCSQLVKEEKFHTLRARTLNCMLVLTGNGLEDDVKKSCSNIVMLMLPGIVSLCLSTAVSNITQNHEVTVMALRLWSHVVTLVMQDDLEVEKQDSNCVPDKSSMGTKEKVTRLMNTCKRTQEWVDSTAKQLVVVSEKIVGTQSHPHWKVRNELAISCNLVISSCSRNMEPSLMFLVDALIVLSQDEIGTVSLFAKNALEQFSEKCESDCGKSLVENIEENFYRFVLRLPRVVNGTDENAQLSELSLLGGYLSLLGPARLPHMLNSSAHLDKLMSALIHLVELDTSGAKIIEEEFIIKDYDDYEAWSKNSKSWRTFRHFSSDRLVQKLEEICHILSECCGIFLSHHLLDLFETNSLQRKEITLLINLIATYDLEKNADVELMNAILDTYLEPSNWYLPISKTDSLEDNHVTSSDLPLVEVRSNVVQICLLIEGIGDLALAVGGSKFSPCLLRCLYLLLERAGSPLEVISEAGLYALNSIIKACSLKDMTSLIDSYSDYLIHHVSLRLKNVTRYPQVLNVFIVIISKCTVHALPSLQEIINNVLMYSCDVFQDRSIISFLHVFLTFVSYAQKWMNSDETKVISKELGAMKEKTPDPVEDFLELHRLKLAASNFDGPADEEHAVTDNIASNNAQIDPNDSEMPDCSEFYEEPEKKKEIPETIIITISILSRSLNFLPYKDESLQILVLQILERGICVMQDWTDELLPVVHKIWAPLVERFNAQKPLIVHRSFNLLLVMAKLTKDFIRRRTIEEVLPKLFSFLLKTEKNSYRQDVGAAYRMTQQFKLQHALLDGLGTVIVDLDCLEKTTHELLTCASVYLSALQPVLLQESAVKLFETVASKYRDLTWLILVSLKDRIEFKSPDPVFPSYEFSSSQWNVKELQKNVDRLLEII